MTPRSLLARVPRAAVERGQLALLAGLAVLTVAAWALTVHQARTMDMPMGVVLRAAADPEDMPADPMAGMDMDTPTAASSRAAASTGMVGMDVERWAWDGGVTFLLAWAVMMAAMMFPAAAPMLLLFRSVTARQANSRRAFAPTWMFAAGYLLLWTAAGAGTWAFVQLGGELGSRLGAAERETWGPLALGATLMVAGLYQFIPLKYICLRQCQSPVGFLMTRWRSGSFGALRMGSAHGVYCLGCCWALFAVLVAAGVMSLAWMLLVTLVVFAEKVLPLGPRAPRVVGVAFLILGVLVAGGATDMPWVA